MKKAVTTALIHLTESDYITGRGGGGAGTICIVQWNTLDLRFASSGEKAGKIRDKSAYSPPNAS